ncbi:hypothetical protein J7399_12830 [Shimia sp. R9_1]|uniref:hypothetical protein n=1 Tax=Shimia sp. R9_1 TaxID=2821111 RepID=UPI001ADA3246|nr:hypothetical protein [Shimia sp. R9_1]MBO9408317.1 hypothetical protein [Shimia sp. R9_1]
MDRIILTMKWGTLYSAEYVNVLYNACKAHMSVPFRFVCLTDDNTGFVDGVEAYDIPDLGLPKSAWGAGAWPKLGVFSKELYGLSGRALFIDLDTVISGDLAEMFDFAGAFVCLDSRPWRYKSGAPRTGTGIFAFDINALGAVVDRLHENMNGHLSTYENEQDFLHGEFGSLGFGDIQYWPDDWIQSFKYHLRQPLGVDRFKHPNPPSAKILCFHGIPRPIDLINPPRGNWDRFPHYGRGRVPWMVDYWVGFGGSLQD